MNPTPPIYVASGRNDWVHGFPDLASFLDHGDRFTAAYASGTAELFDAEGFSLDLEIAAMGMSVTRSGDRDPERIDRRISAVIARRRRAFLFDSDVVISVSETAMTQRDALAELDAVQRMSPAARRLLVMGGPHSLDGQPGGTGPILARLRRIAPHLGTHPVDPELTEIGTPERPSPPRRPPIPNQGSFFHMVICHPFG